ncbi:MAG TPA: thermonuclease family protein [bacterium]
MREIQTNGSGRRERGALACGLVALALVCAAVVGCGKPDGPAARETAADAGPARSSRGRGATAAPAPAVAAARSGKVVRIRDGDSIVVLEDGVQVEVRLHGIDAPEQGQAFGREAKRRAGELAFGRVVRLESRGKDAWDRTLAEVFLPDGRSLNRELVSEGMAWWFRKYVNDTDLAAREREARDARRGLWADRAPVPPWEWRKSRRQ